MTSITTIELEHERMKQFTDYKLIKMKEFEEIRHKNIMVELQFMADHEIKSYVRGTKVSEED